MKRSLEIVIKQVRLKGSFETGGRIRVAECLRQTVSNRWASVRRRSFTKCFCLHESTSLVSENCQLTDSFSMEVTWLVEVLLYVHRNRRFIRDVHLDFHTAPEL